MNFKLKACFLQFLNYINRNIVVRSDCVHGEVLLNQSLLVNIGTKRPTQYKYLKKHS